MKNVNKTLGDCCPFQWQIMGQRPSKDWHFSAATEHHNEINGKIYITIFFRWNNGVFLLDF
jgi:hypothetical protein